MKDFENKLKTISELRQFLLDRDFFEVSTPVLRRDPGSVIPRIRLEAGEFALRDSHELQLRWLLKRFHSVFEIGSCFRNENEKDRTKNCNEFLLMEMFTSRLNLADIKRMVKELLWTRKPGLAFEEISIADHIKADFGIDLMQEPQPELYPLLEKRYGKGGSREKHLLVQNYIEAEIEPLTDGKIAFLEDFPACTCSYANIVRGDVISRFELFANRIELANAFDDECDPDRFERRNSIPIFKKEEQAIAGALRDGSLPAASAGLGIGIERLCMFLYDISDIRVFSFPSAAF